MDRPLITLAHSPDADDAFMWWPLASPDEQTLSPLEVATGERAPFRFRLVTADIETLNEAAEAGLYDVTALSCAHYPLVATRYAITACGASLGDGIGPKLVTAVPMELPEFRESLSPDRPIAIPGRRTSAYATARLLLGDFAAEVVSFEEIMPAVASGRFHAGIVIHEGQLTYHESGLHLVCDLGAWWGQEHGLPMPLGLNVIRRDLEATLPLAGALVAVTTWLRRSVDYAMANRGESVRYALNFARDVNPEQADEFIRCYVNDWTLSFGEEGERAVRTFLAALADADIVPEATVDVIAPAASATQ